METGIARRVGLFGLIAVAAVGTAWALLPEALPIFRSPPAGETGNARSPPAAGPATTASPAPQQQPATQPVPEPPRFDVARVGARGMLVTAGRAAPGAEVILLEGDRELGRARADARGEWVILPGEPLAPGARELALRASNPGQDPVPGRETVLLVVPEQPVTMAQDSAVGGRGLGDPAATGEPASGPLAVLLPPVSSGGAGPRVLQGAPPAEAAGRRGLGLDVVDYDDAGGIRFAGSAAPGATVRLYVGEAHVGDAVADASGRWQLTPEEQPRLGRHTLRLDQLAASGTVAARIEVPFQRDRMPEALVQNGRVVVQPGYSLWRIARAAYGQGVRYTVIYQANRGQIRDPELIYPGQVFTVPEEAPQAESSRSR